MVLLLDIGNSRIKWGYLQGCAITAQGAFLREWNISDTLAGHFGYHTESPTRIVAGCVGTGELVQTMDKWFQGHWGVGVERVHSSGEYNSVKSGYRDPATLGVDRWAAVVAAYQRNRRALCVVDCGTALTIDWVAADGQHIGGVISPGYRLLLDSLIHNIAELHFDGLEGQLGSVGQSTDEAIGLGVLSSITALIECNHKECCKRLSDEADLILTGGDAQHIARYLPVPHVLDPTLVMRGIGLLAGLEIK